MTPRMLDSDLEPSNVLSKNLLLLPLILNLIVDMVDDSTPLYKFKDSQYGLYMTNLNYLNIAEGVAGTTFDAASADAAKVLCQTKCLESDKEPPFIGLSLLAYPGTFKCICTWLEFGDFIAFKDDYNLPVFSVMDHTAVEYFVLYRL